MTSLIKRALGTGVRDIVTVDDYALALSQYQLQYELGLNSTYGKDLQVEKIGGSFETLARLAYQRNGIVFSCMLVRQLVFSSVRFRFQNLRNGKPSDMFANRDLALLERPSPGETTQDLLSRVIQDADLAGNFYGIETTPFVLMGGDSSGTQVLRLRPDWVDIATMPLMYRSPLDGQVGQIGRGKFAYVYTEGGEGSGNDPVVLAPEDVSHFAPVPDPLANFRGMSWLTPVVREIQNDTLMNNHKEKFFTKGGTPNLIVKHADGAKKEAVLEWAAKVQAGSGQLDNAYKTLNLYPGADATVVGSNMQDIDFKAVQGAGETRIAAAAGVPPVIAGFSEGLESATYSNYAQARRRFADGTMHPLWQNVAGTFEQIVPAPGSDSRLWYDADDIPFLREDEADAANIAQVRASTINSYITAGFTPDSAVKAVETGDNRLLEHTGLYSVQLQAPGSGVVVDSQDPGERSRSDSREAPVHLHLSQPAPSVTVEGAQVHVPEQAAPEVRVEVAAPDAPNVYVDVATPAAPEVRIDNAITVDPTPIEVRTNVEAPSVTVEAPRVTVEAPSVTVERSEMPAPVVNVSVEPTPVTVENQVEVPAPEVVIATPKRTKTTSRVQRDHGNDIVGSTAVTEILED